MHHTLKAAVQRITKGITVYEQFCFHFRLLGHGRHQANSPETEETAYIPESMLKREKAWVSSPMTLFIAIWPFGYLTQVPQYNAGLG